jgi:hypothetical protein
MQDLRRIYRRFGRIFRILGLFVLVSRPLAAQDHRALIFHAQGVDFALTAGGERSIIDASGLGSKGITLNRSAMIQTGAGTFVEMQILPSRTVIKISENSSVVYNGFDENGRFTDMALLYGRIRLVSGNGTGSRITVIRAGNASVRIPNGDLGVDYVIDPALGGEGNSRPLLRVYNFQGNVEVFPFVPGAAVSAISLGEGESVLLEINPPVVYAERGPMDREILLFWSRHPFEGLSFLSRDKAAVPEISLLTERESSEGTTGDLAARKENEKAAGLTGYKASRAKTALLGIGLGLTVAGAAAQGIAFAQYSGGNERFGRLLHYTGYVPLSMGLASLLWGTIHNPRILPE